MKSMIFHGVAASPGIGFGKIFLLEEEELIIVQKTISKENLKKEIQRFRKALSGVEKEMEKDKEEMLHVLGKSHARLADANLLLLQDPIFTKDVERSITKDLVNAEFAIQQTLEKITRTFDSLADEYFRERKNDIMEVGNKILRHLMGKEKREVAEMLEGSIVVAHNLLPSDTVALKTDFVNGFAIDVGGKTSHTALLAQGLEIPAVVGLKDISGRVQSGQMMIIDGNQGLVIIDPDPQVLANYQREKEIQSRENQDLAKLKDLPAQTLDGKRVELASNIETGDEVESVLSHGSEGIGLFRTEYLFMNRADLPSEEEQFEHYSRVAKQMMPYFTIFRTLDIGGDKLPPFMSNNGIAAEEKNPMMGLRALRLCLKYPDLFKAQLRALLRASAHGRVRIMFPMVSGVEEFHQAKLILESVRHDLMRLHVPIAPKIEVGAMIEVPSAALTADLLAQEADFLSVGTNDLIQYTLAVDRINENTAAMYEPSHLSILRLIKMIIDAAHSAGKWVGMCGEMASDSNFTRLLLGLELDEFSVVPAFVPKLKKIIRSTNLTETQKLAAEILGAKDYATLQEMLNRARIP